MSMHSGNCAMLLTMCAAVVVAAAPASTPSSNAAPPKGQLVRFHPISRAQYESILHLTAQQPVISQGRLINSGLQSLGELRSTISEDISSGWQQFLRISGLRPSENQKSPTAVQGYPLCVIKTSDLDLNTDDHDSPRNAEDDNGAEEDDGHTQQDYYAHMPTDYYNGHHSGEEDSQDHHGRPVVNCVVVVKGKDKKRPHKPTDHGQHHHGAHMPAPPMHEGYPGPGYYPYPYNPYPYPYGYYAQQVETPVKERRVQQSVKATRTAEAASASAEESSQLYYQQLLDNYYRPQFFGYPLPLYPPPYAAPQSTDTRRNSEEYSDNSAENTEVGSAEI